MPLVSQALDPWRERNNANSSLQHWENDSVAEHLSGMRQDLGYIPLTRKETEEEKTEEKEKSKF